MVGGVRKGSWTEEEDSLLRKCIEKYGEGKWHRVPLRAGLNRCRKSCRLRWLNYLRPNIKRGNFSLDEVDLIVRLHKLLGNRWSLIAGRLPGRTANDVKNYWNTHQTRKCKSKQKLNLRIHNPLKATITEATKVVKPRPRTFTRPIISESLYYSRDEKATPIASKQDQIIKKIPSIENSYMELFKGLFENDQEGAGGSWPSSSEEEEQMNRFWFQDIPIFLDEGNNVGDKVNDMDFWGLDGYSEDVLY